MTQQALATVDPPNESTSLVATIERLAANPQVDVEKLSRIIDLQERVLAQRAREEFFASFAAMQGELPEISELGAIEVNGQVRSRYARNEDIQAAVRPVLVRHGFALSFRNEQTDLGMKITAVLSHRAGHVEYDSFTAGPDLSGSKNGIQAIGSTRHYGQRYTTISILNIITRGEDDDGQRSEGRRRPELAEPAGYAEWLTALEAFAEEGEGKLLSVWEKSDRALRDYLTKTSAGKWDQIKATAKRVGTR